MIRFLNILFLFLIINGILYSKPLNTPLNYGSLKIAESEALFDRELIRKAEYDILEELSKKPDNISNDKAMVLLARIDLISGNLKIAEGKLTEFIEQRTNSPFVPYAAYLRGLVSFEMNDYKKADKYFEEAVLFAKDDFYKRNDIIYKDIAHKSMYWRGISMIHFGKNLDAIPILEESYSFYSSGIYSDEAIYNIARIEESTRNYEKAIEYYNKAINKYPNSNVIIASNIRVANNYNILRQPAAALKSINKAESILNFIENNDSLALKYEEQMYHDRARENILFIRGTSNNLAGRFKDANDNFSAFTGTFSNSELLNYSRLGSGWALLNLKRYDEAIKLYNLIIFDENADLNTVSSAKLYRAIAQKRNGNTEVARKELSALSMQPSYPFVAHALLEVGQMNYEAGEFIQARKNLERAERESVDAVTTVRIHLLLGATYMELKLWESAAEQYRKAEKLSKKADLVNMPDKYWYISESLIKRGIALVNSLRSAEAIEPLLTFIAENKNHPRTDEALFWLAEAYYRSDLLNNAAETYSKILELYPDTKRKEQILYGLGWTYFRQQNFRGSTNAFEKMMSEYPNTEYALEVLTRQGDGYYKRKNYSKAANYYRRASQKGPSTDEGQYAAYQLCHALFSQGSYERAISSSMDYTARYPNSSYAPNTIYLIGWIRFQQGRYNEAIDNFNYLIDSYNRSVLVPRAYYAIGDSYYNMSEFENAMKYYKIVVEDFPSNALAPEAFESIQYCLISLGREDEAVNIINDYITENEAQSPFVEDFQYKKGELFYQGRKYKDAITEYEKFAEKYPNSDKNAEALYWKAKSYANLNENIKAAKEYNKIVRQFPKSEYAPLALLENGILHKEMVMINEADSIFNELQLLFPKHKTVAQAGFERAVMNFALGDTTKSLKLFEDVADNYSDSDYGDQSRYRLGMFYRSKDEYDSALYHFKILAEVQENPMIASEAQYRIGEIYMRQKNYNKAIESFLISIQKFSGYDDWYSLALLNLGEAYENIEDYQNAREIYKALQEWRPDDDFGKAAKARFGRIKNK